ncbi:MAG: alkaline phosphatase [Bacteroidales bacterium]|jgi:alkaline phosphatase|nr:alkaline phosphatase [Bacteroidales bacterium]
MKKSFAVVLLAIVVFFLSCGCGRGQHPETVKPVRNVIVMIPDGTSVGVVSAARWYKMYGKTGNGLHLDPYMCGTVSTFCSNAPIGDSAPTTSCYMTGVPQRAGNVATYPVADPGKDLVPLDATMAYQPLATVLEAARILQGKSTGLVVTCEFPHATPADCSSHYYNRGNYQYIAPQIAYNNLDVVFGGGNDMVTNDMKAHFKNNGTTLIQNDAEAFRNYHGNGKLWALFGAMGLPFDLDRDPAKAPSLEEMTRKALDILSKNRKGFFLMVEGSEIDHAAHANDAVGCITEFIAFDNAVGAAMEFARKDGETAVIILPDHGNSGFTIGRRGCGGSQSSLEDLFGSVSQYKKTAAGIESILKVTPPDQIKTVFKQYTHIDLTDEEVKTILESKDYAMGDYTQVSNNRNMRYSIIAIMNSRTCFGFTSGGHTAEEVFLAAWHPSGDRPTGHVTNMQINEYLCKAMGFKISLPDLTRKIFAKHTDVLAGLKYEIAVRDNFPVLTVEKGGNTLSVRAFSSVAYLNGRPIYLGSVTVYVDKNETFYLPENILKKAGL